MKRERILIGISSLQLALFAPLAWWASKHPQPLKEIAITRFMQKRQSTFKRRFVQVLSTFSGSAVYLNFLVIPVTVLLWRKKLRLEAIMTVATLWTNALTRTGIKRLINRPRPKPPLIHIKRQSKGRSFPSGHVASSINFWGWLFAAALFHKEVKQPWRSALLSVPPLLIAFVGPSRIYLGDHWATDVLGGYLFGGGWFGFSLRLYLKLKEQASTGK
jgi:undecaprenyl-diphosphatase